MQRGQCTAPPLVSPDSFQPRGAFQHPGALRAASEAKPENPAGAAEHVQVLPCRGGGSALLPSLVHRPWAKPLGKDLHGGSCRGPSGSLCPGNRRSSGAGGGGRGLSLPSLQFSCRLPAFLHGLHVLIQCIRSLNGHVRFQPEREIFLRGGGCRRPRRLCK